VNCQALPVGKKFLTSIIFLDGKLLLRQFQLALACCTSSKLVSTGVYYASLSGEFDGGVTKTVISAFVIPQECLVNMNFLIWINAKNLTS